MRRNQFGRDGFEEDKIERQKEDGDDEEIEIDRLIFMADNNAVDPSPAAAPTAAPGRRRVHLLCL